MAAGARRRKGRRLSASVAPVGAAQRVVARDAAGKKVSLATLPLVAYALRCGEMGRDYAVAKGDLMFCPSCQKPCRVARILAQ